MNPAEQGEEKRKNSHETRKEWEKKKRESARGRELMKNIQREDKKGVDEDNRKSRRRREMTKIITKVR